ncbi:dTDP-4-dehydrorhamnose reductase [Litoreibacter ponti]|uniref:dTDP-4-dehydrorhamnose reductase n=1 Tax=Litoreibacter ponti TaxID=1510457 RepID=A0A2T6BPJ2_9RHOB|nr:epimerase [Litoreibacter ponti]PTX58000.1 dTDP-4-dehydrorhamnose reductase [Litoreibacter ponti]
MPKTVLILGANGRFGRNAQSAFSWANWNVATFDRATESLPDAAWGADVIVNAWNPAYPNWAKVVPKLTRQVIATARDTGATVLLPGNVYPYGPDMPAQLSETTPHAAPQGLGKIKAEMEAAYRDAGVRTIILRAGDFIDTEASGNWFDKIITAKLEKGIVTYPGDLDTPHAWAFLHDVADAAVALAEQADSLPRFAEVQFDGFTLTGRELHAALEQATGRALKLQQMSWLPLTLARPFWPMAKYLQEMRYLWNTPHGLCGERLRELAPELQPTPLIEALAASVPDQIDPDRMVPRTSLRKRRPFNLCTCNSKTA